MKMRKTAALFIIFIVGFATSIAPVVANCSPPHYNNPPPPTPSPPPPPPHHNPPPPTPTASPPPPPPHYNPPPPFPSPPPPPPRHNPPPPTPTPSPPLAPLRYNPPQTPPPVPPKAPNSPPPKTPVRGSGKCPIDAVKLGACVDLLGLINIGIGNRAVNKCCPLLEGVVALEAALCLCTTIRVKLLNINVILPLALNLFVQCGKIPPPGFTCPALN